MPMIIWVKYFLEAQGYIVSDNLLHQDNQSLIKLEQNGKASGGKRTRHISIKYYFGTDRIAGGDLRVEYCPTEKVLADFFYQTAARKTVLDVQVHDHEHSSNSFPCSGVVKQFASIFSLGQYSTRRSPPAILSVTK